MSEATLSAEALEQIHKRRTFAIISHPDAGKTTLTEKLLLYGGAIRQAGSVKARKAERHATSDWMEIEKQRGISVTSSAMQFEYDGYRINILDTPGHQDFSEDTYRVLVAADAAVMLIDAAKGVEEQTIKLFKVCRLRNIPIFTFVNKMDRASKDPFALMEELEQVLGIRSCPMNWPIGVDGDFQGVYQRESGNMSALFRRQPRHEHGRPAVCERWTAPRLPPRWRRITSAACAKRSSFWTWRATPLTSRPCWQARLTPLFFGSAVTNFGVEPLPGGVFVHHAAAPVPHGRHRRDCTHRAVLLRLHLQDSGQHEPRPPRPPGLRARGQRRVPKGHDRLSFRHGQADPAQAAPAVHGRRARGRRKRLCGRHHRPVRPRLFPPGRRALRRPQAALFLHPGVRVRSTSPACARRTA